MNPENSSPQREPADDFEIENIIREKAYDLWDAAGRPPNAAMDFWLQARQMVNAERLHDAAISPADPHTSNDK